MYTKCELIRTVKGIGNYADYGRGEFIVTNDDTHEIWRRNGESMINFKNWYSSISNGEKLTGSYPAYDIR